MTAENVINLADGRIKRQRVVNEIFEQHGAALRAYLRMILATEADRDDAVQDVFERLARMEALETKYKDPEFAFRPYLFAIARNLVADRMRRAKVRWLYQTEMADVEQHVNTEYSPEEALVAKEQLKVIRTVLAKSKQAHRTAFIMSRFEFKSYSEIAEAMNISVSSVEKYVATVLGSLREGLRDV